MTMTTQNTSFMNKEKYGKTKKKKVLTKKKPCK
jgi:hypothetical protein